MTEWKLYKTLYNRKIYAGMEKPAFVFDGRNILPHDELYQIGFTSIPSANRANLTYKNIILKTALSLKAKEASLADQAS
jgi:UDPglucose 6-dehydrogenase